MKLVCFYVCVIKYLFLDILQAYNFPSSNDFHKNNAPTPEMARLNGYRCDVHLVTSEDEYLVQVFRLPGGRTTPLNCSLPPVLLLHGLLDSSTTWLIAGPDQGLAYLLADQGYDVWLGNTRGNTYGSVSFRYKIDEDNFWDFSFEESAVFGLSGMIDYILNTTGFERLLYVGESQGATEFFVLCSIRPEYNRKVQHMVALAPIAYLNFAPSIVRYFAPFSETIPVLLKAIAHGEIFSRNSVFTNFVQSFCAIEANQDICAILLQVNVGFDPIGFNKTLVPTIVGHFPAGTSVKTLMHFGQLINSKRFQRFDYGAEKNLELYNSTKPPLFDISQIQVSLSFFFADNDAFADPKDVMTLASLLQTEVDLYRVNLTTFNHIDFVWGKNVKELVYDKVISILRAKQTLSNKGSCGP